MMPAQTQSQSNPVPLETTCCIVGGGPAGMVLAYLLARRGIDVTLLEMHGDFDRDFRGDTLHPSVLAVMDEVGLADKLLQLPHTELSEFAVQTQTGRVTVANFHSLDTKFPFIAFMPQAQFLDFLAKQATTLPAFHLVLGALVEELVEADGVVQGVRYRTREGLREVRALLTVGADGRFSRVRKLSGLGETAVKMSQPLDVLWLRLPRHPEEARGVMARFGKGHVLIELDRGREWQIAMVIRKGSFAELRAAGLQALRDVLVEAAPELVDRVGTLQDWKQVALLTVQADRLTQWYKPGLLLIGDAAHVMSPAGGNGINYAIMDAVAAANLLVKPLQNGQVRPADLAQVQKRRAHPVQWIQTLVNVGQDRLLARALDPNQSLQLPGIARVPLFGRAAARVLAFGFRPEHVNDSH